MFIRPIHISILVASLTVSGLFAAASIEAAEGLWVQTTQEDFQLGSSRLRVDTYETSGSVTLLSYDDDFDGDVLNLDRWELESSPSGFQVSEDAGCLALDHLLAGVSGGCGVYLRAGLNGDIDYQAQWTLTSWPGVNTAKTALGMRDVHRHMERGFDTTQPYDDFICAYDGNTWTFLQSTALSGTFRIERVGSQVKHYYYGQGWQVLHSSTLDASYEVFPKINIWTRKDCPNPSFSVCFDSFHVTSAHGYSDPVYAVTGIFRSGTHCAPFDFCSGALDWDASTPPGTSVRFQLRSAPDSAALWSRTWVGPDGTGSTYYETPGPLWAGHDGDRWIHYRAYLDASDPYASPVLEEVRVHYFSCATDVADRHDFHMEAAASQSYPNPFNPLCTIRYEIPQACKVSLRVLDVRGSLVRSLVNAYLEPGSYSELWDGRGEDGSELPSGVYFYCLEADGFSATRKMVLLR